MRSGVPVSLSGLAALVLACGLAHCTGEASFVLPLVDAGAPSARYEAVCAAWARRECAYTNACQTTVFTRWEDDDQCIARETLSCELLAADPEVSFDPALVEGCVLPPDCSAATGTIEASEAPFLCLPAGKAPIGAPCVWSSGCQSGQCIYDYLADVSPACGTCQPPLRCGCAANQRCVVQADDVTCVTLPDAGEACGAPLFACNESSCVPSSADAGTCEVVPEGGVGAPCSASPMGPDCVFSATSQLYCDPTNHCSPYTAAIYGQSCTTPNGGLGSICVGAGWCDSDVSGVCRPPAQDGAPCDSQVPPCLPPARCLAGACVFPSLAACSP